MNNKTSNGNGLAELERRLWSAADQLWANSPLRPSEYSTPVLGLSRMAFYQNVAANGIGNFQSQRFLESEYLVYPADSKARSEMLNMVDDLTSSTLADQIFDLRRTRDLLLPKLMSGALDVWKLDMEPASTTP